MDPKIKARWIEALRSGAYQQTTGGLKQDGGYCCLGVLCDLVKDDVNGEWVRDGRPAFRCEYPEGTRVSDGGYLPYPVQRLAGINNGRGDLPIRSYLGKDSQGFSVSLSTLAMLNDHGWTFPQIADVIEEQF